MKRTIAIAALCMLVISAPLFGQRKKDPLTDQQIEEVREAGDQPLVRIKLFIGYVDERAKEIHTLNADAGAQNKTVQMHNLFDEFTRLSDELQDNMDAFNDEHADLRKALKEVIDKSGEWTTALNEPKASAQYDFMRKSAVDANQSVHDAATQMLADEVKYFADKKKADKEAEKNADKNETR
jgi:hypothetical protein